MKALLSKPDYNHESVLSDISVPHSSNRDFSLRLLDKFGRVASDLRISITDRCNLRCSYCIPPDANDWLPPADFLNAAEIARLSAIALDLGIRKIRITGGEPLLRPDLAEIISRIKREFLLRNLPPLIALTTNAIGLEKRLPELIAAGLQRINLSLDSLNPERFHQLTHRNQLDKVLSGVEAAAKSPLKPIKINTVILDWDTLQEIPALINFCITRDIQWRAIEFMPIGPLARKITAPNAADIMAKIRENYIIEPVSTKASSPARCWRVSTKPTQKNAIDSESSCSIRGIIGVIASVSNPFCAACTRTRLSADGKIYSCLFSSKFTDLGQALRSGASNQELATLWQQAAWHKPAGHQVLEPLDTGYRMSKIGG